MKKPAKNKECGREKALSQLMKKYNEALDLLEQQQIKEGSAMLKEIIEEAVIDEDNKQVIYGAKISLAEIYSDSKIIGDLQTSLSLYLDSNSIQEEWSTHRKISIILKRLGMFAKAIEYLNRGLKICPQELFQDVLIHQLCVIYFMIDDEAGFIKTYNQFRDKYNQEKMLSLYNYFKKGVINEEVSIFQAEKREYERNLSDMETQCESFDDTVEIKLDESNYKIFFDNIKKTIQTLTNPDPKKQDTKQLSSTYVRITIITGAKKQYKKTAKQLATQQENLQKQSRRQIEKQIKKQEQDTFNLEVELLRQRKQIIDGIYETMDIHLELQSGRDKYGKLQLQQETQKNNKCPVALSLSKVLEKTYQTMHFLIYDLIDHFFDNEGTQNFKDIHFMELGAIIVQFDPFINEITDDQQIRLKLLRYIYLKFEAKQNKRKQPNQKRSLSLFRYKKYIDKERFHFLLEKESLSQQNQKELLKLFGLIHLNPHFQQLDIVEQCCKLTRDENLYQQLKNLLEKQNKGEDDLLDELELLAQNQFSEIFGYKLLALQELFLQDPKVETVHRLLQICINQLNLASQKQQFQSIYSNLDKYAQPLFYIEKVEMDQVLAILCLQYGVILTLDLNKTQAAVFISKFVNFSYEYQYRGRQESFLQIINIPDLDVYTLFQNCHKESILDQFVEVKEDINQFFLKRYLRLTRNFASDRDIDLETYLFSQIDFANLNELVCLLSPLELLEESDDQQDIEEQAANLKYLDEYSSEEEEEIYREPRKKAYYLPLSIRYEFAQKPYFLFGQQYKHDKIALEALRNQKISININNDDLIKQIRIFVKEEVKQQFHITTKKIFNQLRPLIQEYYCKVDKLDYIDLRFLGIFADSIFKKDKKQFKKYGKLMLLIESHLDHFERGPENQRFYNYVVYLIGPGEVKTEQKAADKIAKLQFYYRDILDYQHLAPLFYYLGLYHQQEFTDKEKSFESYVWAVSYEKNYRYWEQLYTGLFTFALDQIRYEEEQMGRRTQQKQKVVKDWFLMQKKLHSFVNKELNNINISEQSFILDLIKLEKYKYDHSVNYDLQVYERFQSNLLNTYQKKTTIEPLKDNQVCQEFRIHLLIQKLIVKNIQNLSIQQMFDHLDALEKLALQPQINPNEFYEVFQGENIEEELEYDYYFSVFKFIKRMIQYHQYSSLYQFVNKLKDKFKLRERKVMFIFPSKKNRVKYQMYDKSEENDEFIKQYRHYTDQILEYILEKLSSRNTYFIKKQPNKKTIVFLTGTAKLGQNQRYVVLIAYYLYKLLYYSNMKTDMMQGFKQLITPNNLELVQYYRQFGSQYIEKDSMISHYYNHDIVFYRQRGKILNIIIKILLRENKLKQIFNMMAKLKKLYFPTLCKLIENFLSNKYYPPHDYYEGVVSKIYNLYESNSKIKERINSNNEMKGLLQLHKRKVFRLENSKDQEPTPEQVNQYFIANKKTSKDKKKVDIKPKQKKKHNSDDESCDLDDEAELKKDSDEDNEDFEIEDLYGQIFLSEEALEELKISKKKKKQQKKLKKQKNQIELIQKDIQKEQRSGDLNKQKPQQVQKAQQDESHSISQFIAKSSSSNNRKDFKSLSRDISLERQISKDVQEPKSNQDKSSSSNINRKDPNNVSREISQERQKIRIKKKPTQKQARSSSPENPRGKKSGSREISEERQRIRIKKQPTQKQARSSSPENPKGQKSVSRGISQERQKIKIKIQKKPKQEQVKSSSPDNLKALKSVSRDISEEKQIQQEIQNQEKGKTKVNKKSQKNPQQKKKNNSKQQKDDHN